MAHRTSRPKAIALWRLSLIEEALDPDLTRRGRSETLRHLARTPVRWPSGDRRPVSLATLYRWVAAFREGGLDALRPRPRSDRGRKKRPLPPEVVSEALRLLEGDPDQPLSFLVTVLQAHFKTLGRPVKIARSTLQRRLAEQERYAQLVRVRQRARRRTRFVAAAPHRIWQCDAKGPFPVRLRSGERILVHVLTILDDATRAVLATAVVPSPTLGAAVRVFRAAVRRWGLCHAFYADRATIFDAHAFRAGVAVLGVRRIPTQARNAPARGKIEAFHRTIERWFAKRLARQVVVDLVHLQQLLEGLLFGHYQTRRHRTLRQSPEAALAGRASDRRIPPARLHEAFLQEHDLRSHRVTGEVELQKALWLVPGHLRGRKLTFLADPAEESPPVVLEPGSKRRLSLRRARVRPEDAPPEPEPERWGAGPLQTLHDAWTGKGRPLAEAGFGLPELYALLGEAAGRHVPRTDAEAAFAQRVWADHGPLGRQPTEAAFRAIARDLGPGRPIKRYLDALVARLRRTP